MAHNPRQRVGVSFGGVLFLTVFVLAAILLGIFAAQRFVHWIGYPG